MEHSRNKENAKRGRRSKDSPHASQGWSNREEMISFQHVPTTTEREEIGYAIKRIFSNTSKTPYFLLLIIEKVNQIRNRKKIKSIVQSNQQ
jgi:hypothetical protein